MKKYYYYVSFVHPQGAHIGRGYIEAPRTELITDFSGIAEIAAEYNREYGNGFDYVIADYGLSRVEEVETA